ncbi:MAG: hypothetical protein ABI184_08680 [Ginsengibacter sp.]
MAVSPIDKELIKHFIKLTEPQKESLLQMIKSFAMPDRETREPVSLEEYNKELDDAMERINEGNFTTFEELQKEMQSW